MRRLVVCASLLAAAFVLLGAAAGTAKTPVPKTLLTSTRPVYAFAQSSAALGWIAGDGRVRMERLPGGKVAVVGTVDPPERSYGAVISVAGTRALWAWDSGGNSYETSITTGALGSKPSGAALLSGGAREIGDGQRFSGLASGPSDLAFGWVDGRCTDLPFGLCEMCNPLGSCPMELVGGGVSLVSLAAKPSTVPGVPPPALFAVGDGRVAVAPARSPTSPAGPVPRLIEDGPVEVFDLSGRMLARIPLLGLVRGISLNGTKLTVLLERPEGSRQILRFDARNGTYLGTSQTLSPGATDLTTSSGGIVFRVGSSIYLQRGRTSLLMARAAATPVGLSIAGRRIAWAENVYGHGRIRAVSVR
jgi:hypothetical protein